MIHVHSLNGYIEVCIERVHLVEKHICIIEYATATVCCTFEVISPWMPDSVGRSGDFSPG